MTETRVWFWIQIAGAVGLLATAVVSLVLVPKGDGFTVLGYLLVYVDGYVVLPGLAISVVLNAFVIRAHGHAGPSRAEKVLLGIGLLLVFGLIACQIWLPYVYSPGMLIWVLLVGWAIVVLVIAAVRNSSIPLAVRRGSVAS